MATFADILQASRVAATIDPADDALAVHALVLTAL